MQMRNMVIGILAFLLAAFLPAQTNSTWNFAGEGVGYVLLNDVVKLFEDMAAGQEGEAVRTQVKQGLDRLFQEARVASEHKHVDAPFLERYQRVLAVLKLAMLKADMGKSGQDPILDALIIREVNRFDLPEKMSEGGSVQGIGSVAGAVAGELLSLKKYLDKAREPRLP